MAWDVPQGALPPFLSCADLTADARLMKYGANLGVALVASVLSGCSSHSQAGPTPAQESATTAAQQATSLASTTKCPAADWRCFADEAHTVGPLLGPGKASGEHVTGVLVWPAQTGQRLRGMAAQLSRPGQAGYMALTELPGQADLTPTQSWTHSTHVQGVTALFSDEPSFVRLKWNDHGRKMQLAVSKTLPGPVPTEAQMLATANALVLYSGA